MSHVPIKFPKADYKEAKRIQQEYMRNLGVVVPLHECVKKAKAKRKKEKDPWGVFGI